MELSWQRNLPARPDQNVEGDRQGAYNKGAQYIEATLRPEFQAKMTKEEQGLWAEVQTLVKKYVADPNIKSLDKQKKEREAGRQR
jgi:hypothetical protein